ncbi:MAG: class I SAM-dependent methyltransferase, partial [Leptospiraceae bacterium]|nr:class I SAM-dependent methyltransferase [Leptospiraceae bacterium]
MDYKDHFSIRSDEYRRYRPVYPKTLYDKVFSACSRFNRAWDCGCGSGQATSTLAEHFTEVIATDPSEKQISRAIQKPNIRYMKAKAEKVPIPDKSIDLISVAQALHWFEFEAFFKEVKRVAAKGAVFSAWTYGVHSFQQEKLDSLVQYFYRGLLESYWPKERMHVEKKYSSIPFPYSRLEIYSFEMEKEWTLTEMLGYLSTWSAVQAYRQEHGA